jgi:hypothetical protein
MTEVEYHKRERPPLFFNCRTHVTSADEACSGEGAARGVEFENATCAFIPFIPVIIGLARHYSSPDERVPAVNKFQHS